MQSQLLARLVRTAPARKLRVLCAPLALRARRQRVPVSLLALLEHIHSHKLLLVQCVLLDSLALPRLARLCCHASPALTRWLAMRRARLALLAMLAHILIVLSL